MASNNNINININMNNNNNNKFDSTSTYSQHAATSTNNNEPPKKLKGVLKKKTRYPSTIMESTEMSALSLTSNCNSAYTSNNKPSAHPYSNKRKNGGVGIIRSNRNGGSGSGSGGGASASASQSTTQSGEHKTTRCINVVRRSDYSDDLPYEGDGLGPEENVYGAKNKKSGNFITRMFKH